MKRGIRRKPRADEPMSWINWFYGRSAYAIEQIREEEARYHRIGARDSITEFDETFTNIAEHFVDDSEQQKSVQNPDIFNFKKGRKCEGCGSTEHLRTTYIDGKSANKRVENIRLVCQECLKKSVKRRKKHHDGYIWQT